MTGDDPDRFHVITEGGVTWLVGGRHRWPCSEWVHDDLKMPLPDDSDYAHRIRRVRIMVESGWELSIVWGPGTYGSNWDAFMKPETFDEHPTSVEVAVLWDGDWEPCSNVTPDELAAMVAQMSLWPSNIAPPSWAIQGGRYRPGEPAGGYPSHAPGGKGTPPNGSPDEE